MMRRQVFVDTWTWVALAVTDDPNHSLASEVSAQIRASGGRLITSNFVIDEALTRIRYDVSLKLALGLADTLHQMAAQEDLVIVTIDAPLEAEALDWFGRYTDQVFSFTDCTSFALMRRLGIIEAFTNDSHLATAGFVPLAIR